MHRLHRIWVTDSSTGGYGIGLRTNNMNIMKGSYNETEFSDAIIPIPSNIAKENLTQTSNSDIDYIQDEEERQKSEEVVLTGKELFKSVPKPVLVVGMPKAGTTTINEYFKCGGAKVSHWRCYNNEESLCGALIRDNIKSNRPALENTGNYEVYAQLDGDAYYPQMVALDEINNAYPNATFILNLRNVTNWANSVKHFTPG